MMQYVKAIFVALVGAVAGAALWILVVCVLPLYVPMLIARVFNRGGVGAASISSESILLAAVVGFVVAGWWSLRSRGRTG